ncbi:MAG TPA: hypothetical protein VN426_06250 [Syntrophomonadaceae bacterium]|nr:hypothetical protein [Syntrophomonadaceae bacterium]
MLELPACVTGDEIEYIEQHRSGMLTKKGNVTGQTDIFITVSIPCKYGSKPDTIHRSDLITGAVNIKTINAVPYIAPRIEMPSPAKNPYMPGELKRKREENTGTKGEHSMKSLKPSNEVLADLFEKASYNITQAAKMNEPPVTDVTMGKWLREAGIIPETSKKEKKEAPPASELRQAWEECNRKMAVIARRYEVTAAVAKGWLKEAGIIYESFTEIETTPPPEEDHGTSKELEGSFEKKCQEQSTFLASPLDIAEPPRPDAYSPEAIKKMVDFCLAPLLGRLEKAEASIGALAKVILSEGMQNQERPDKVQKLAILFAAVLEVL